MLVATITAGAVELARLVVIIIVVARATFSSPITHLLN